VVFFAIRAALALVPVLALRRPIKKWAAAAALVAAAFYLLLSGAEVATQRAFIMAAIVLIGVMVDRPALLRNLALAALAVLLIAPEAVAHPSFQMSFAATLALVAAYERGLPWVAASTQLLLQLAREQCGSRAPMPKRPRVESDDLPRFRSRRRGSPRHLSQHWSLISFRPDRPF
jgi:ComEC/Rec2-related protein